MMADRIDQQLGNYSILRLIGRGGFAEVYLGEHIYLKTQVSIKILQTKVSNEDDMKGFLQEAQTIARLIHPNIVRVTDFGVDGETPYLVMDYAPNGTLRQRHPKGAVLPLPTIVTYVRQTAAALQHAHDEKLIHRDIKPENMLLSRKDDILLSDFGIALAAQSSRYQNTQDVVGTVAYMSPEQIQGKPRPASDQYSFGVVVYEWLTGERPFQGSFTEMAVQHTVATPPPLHQKLPSISRDVELVVLTALAKNPEQRFVNIEAFANALEQASSVSQGSSFPLTPQWTHPMPETHLHPRSFTPIVLPDQRSENTILATPPTPPQHSNIEPAQQSEVKSTTRDESRAPKRSYSRRAVLVGIVGLAAAAGSGLTWLALAQKTGLPTHNLTATPGSTQIAIHSATPTSPTQTTTPSPTTGPSYRIGTRISTYSGHSNFVYA